MQRTGHRASLRSCCEMRRLRSHAQAHARPSGEFHRLLEGSHLFVALMDWRQPAAERIAIRRRLRALGTRALADFGAAVGARCRRPCKASARSSTNWPRPPAERASTPRIRRTGEVATLGRRRRHPPRAAQARTPSPQTRGPPKGGDRIWRARPRASARRDIVNVPRFSCRHTIAHTRAHVVGLGARGCGGGGDRRGVNDLPVCRGP